MAETFGLGDDDAGVSTQVDPSGTESSTVPGRRLQNPLGDLSSYTYQISLYMITPDAYDAFVATGRRQINALTEASGVSDAGGAFLVAQSGGINNSIERRAPGFVFDYAIDNLSFKTLTSGKATQTSSNNTSFKFQIIEPYGFSFITKLKKAADTLSEYNKQLSYPSNPTRQFFILGIRFFGYDQEGNVADIEDVYEQFYDIELTSLKFKLDGKATIYNIEAASKTPSEGFGVKRGRINNTRVVETTTVGEAIRELFGKLNVEQAELLKAGSIQHENFYEVEFLGGAREIEEASLLAPEDLSKDRWGGPGVRSTEQSNVVAENQAIPDNTKRRLVFEKDTPINEAIGDIIKQSSYLRDALKVVYTTSLEPDPNTGETAEQDPNTKKRVKWYNLSVQLSNARWDKLTSDWAYKITYIIQPYETPIISSPYVNPGINYYGPHKRYQYYFTGENREILSYDQKFDNTYFTVALDPSATPLTDKQPGNSSGGETNVSQIPGKETSQPRLGRQGVGFEAQNTYVTSLYDPGAYAQSKISILGDPDFLMRESPDSISQVYNKFYGSNGFTINPNGGQVFIEIDFKEAIDYTSDTGTLDINDSILFWRYPKEIADIVQGVCYKVRDVTSKFSKGRFEQELTLDIVDFGPSTTTNDETDQTEETASSNSTPADKGIKSDLTREPQSGDTTVIDPPVEDINFGQDADDDRRG